MIYEYRCYECSSTVDIIKPVDEYKTTEHCEECGKAMRKLVSRGQVKIPTFIEGFNPALGESFSSPHEVKDHIRKLKYEEGRELVEVGNDKLEHVKWKPKEYTVG